MKNRAYLMLFSVTAACILGQGCPPVNVNVPVSGNTVNAPGEGSGSTGSESTENTGGNPGGSTGTGSGAATGPVTLLSETASCSFESDGWCRLRLTFSPTQTGRPITVEITGNLTASRPVFGVDDSSGNTVANYPDSTSNHAVTVFTATNTGPHDLTIREFAHFPSQSTVFTVVVTQN